MFRKAKGTDVPAVAAIYEKIIAESEAGRATTGWERSIYPTEETARTAFEKGELYVAKEDDRVPGHRSF